MLIAELTESERRIQDAMLTGRVVDLRRPADPAESSRWSRSRWVRAAVLSGLLTAADNRSIALRLRGARIVGHLNLGGRRIAIPVDLRDCAFTGKVQLAKTAIPELSLRGSYFPFGISGRGLRVDGALNLTDCRFDDRLYLKRLGAEIVFLDAARAYGRGNYAVQLRGADITQELYCRNGFEAYGWTTLYGAKIGGQLVMDGAHLAKEGDIALRAANLEVGQDLHMRGVTVIGQVNVTKAKIGGDLALSGSTLSNPGGQAVNANMVQIGQNALLDDGFNADGEVSFFLGHIAGRLEFDDSRLRNPGGLALDASRTEVGQSMLFNGLRCEGQVKLYGSRIEGQLSLNNTTVVNAGGTALDVVQCEIGQSVWFDVQSHFEGLVNLSNARITNRLRFANLSVTSVRASDLSVDILDDDPACWPTDSDIGGMYYNRLPDGKRGAPRARIAWLRRLLPRYSPQPYTQLVSTYQRFGSSTAVRLVVMAKEDRRRRDHRNFWRRTSSRTWSAVLRWTVGYGFAPWRAIGWVVGCFAVAWAVFAGGPAGAVRSARIPDAEFHPALYALDTLLPVVQLSPGSQWVAHGAYAWWEALFASVGWFLSIVVAAGVAGVFKRD